MCPTFCGSSGPTAVGAKFPDIIADHCPVIRSLTSFHFPFFPGSYPSPPVPLDMVLCGMLIYIYICLYLPSVSRYGSKVGFEVAMGHKLNYGSPNGYAASANCHQ